ncbi:MAG: hypothetical protein CL789_03015 [Chloroflexi bacterium]|nr:hypothetical protein [Chloroflexota bacterium]HCU80780.1 hypothetical protein [Chloroflexota bacterium]
MNTKWTESTKYTVTIVLGLLLVWLIWIAKPLIGPIVISALLAFTLNPLVTWLCNHTRMNHNVAVVVVYTLLTVLLVAFPYIVLDEFENNNDLSETVNWVLDTTGLLFSQSFTIAGITLLPSDWVTNIDQFIAESVATIAGNTLNFIATFTGNMIWVLITMVTLFYFLKDGSRLKQNMLKLAPQNVRHEWEQLLTEIDHAWGAFLRGQLLLMLIVGILAALGGVAIGLPGAVILGVLAGLLDIVPSLGPTVSGIVAIAVGMVLGSTYLNIPNGWFGLLVAALYFFVQQIENIWLRPQIMSNRLRLHPGVIFVGVVGALAVQGILAALLIVPIMASASILGRYFYSKLTDSDG